MKLNTFAAVEVRMSHSNLDNSNLGNLGASGLPEYEEEEEVDNGYDADIAAAAAAAEEPAGQEYAEAEYAAEGEYGAEGEPQANDAGEEYAGEEYQEDYGQEPYAEGDGDGAGYQEQATDEQGGWTGEEAAYEGDGEQLAYNEQGQDAGYDGAYEQEGQEGYGEEQFEAQAEESVAQSGEIRASQSGSRPASVAGSQSGFKGESVAGSQPGTPKVGSRAASVAAGSQPGTPKAVSRTPSVAGSKPASLAGSRPASTAGSKPGSVAGSRPASVAGSTAGKVAASVSGSKPPSATGSARGAPQDVYEEEAYDDEADYQGGSFVSPAQQQNMRASYGSGSGASKKLVSTKPQPKLTFSAAPYVPRAKPYAKANYSHDGNRLMDISNENEKLCSKLMQISKTTSTTTYSTVSVGSGGKLLPCNVAAASVNRRKEEDKTAQDNLNMYKRLQSVKPSKDISRNKLAEEYKKTQEYSKNCSKFRPAS